MMNNLKIYHGSEKIIKNPFFGGGKKSNDFGPGFYCTLDQAMAYEWAVDYKRNGFCNVYNIDKSGLKILDLTSEFSILHWVTLLLQNRKFDIQTDFGKEAYEYLVNHFTPDIDKADILIGYRADDSYFSFAQDFLNNAISVRTLSKAMDLGMLGRQIVIKSEEAFKRLEFVEALPSDSQIFYPKKESRDHRARADYKKLRDQGWKRGEIYIMQIIDEEIDAE